VRRANLADPDFAYDPEDPPGFRSGLVRPGPSLGAAGLGASVYELPPGQALCPYHYESGEEEALLVFAGTPTLRHPDGEDELVPWDLVWFPPGPQGAHEVINRTAETVRVFMFSTVEHPAITVYPDSQKVGIWTGNKADDLIAPYAARVDYFHGEIGLGSEPDPA
jgi:uncharacterized cupin superfamily protein